MALHLIKLCVGVDDIAELTAWQERRLAELKSRGEPPELGHTTRQMPRRRDEIITGGSLYWVIRGVIQLRQPIIDLRPVRGGDGIERCRIVLSPDSFLTAPVPRRAFQGWRYLEAKDAPRDLSSHERSLPPELSAELAELGLL